MDEVRDKTDKIVNKGDILIETTGGGYSNGVEYHRYKIWEMPKIDNGSGYYYHYDGSKSKFYWTNPKNSYKIEPEILPENFLYSFYHGMNTFNSELEEGNYLEIIKRSDWEDNKVNPEDIEQIKTLENLKINSRKEFLDNLDLICNSKYIPMSFIYRVLNVCGIKENHVHNGEQGISSLYDKMNFDTIILIAKEKCNDFLNYNFQLKGE